MISISYLLLNEAIDEQIQDNPDAILYEINEVYDVISERLKK